MKKRNVIIVVQAYSQAVFEGEYRRACILCYMRHRSLFSYKIQTYYVGIVVYIIILYII